MSDKLPKDVEEKLKMFAESTMWLDREKRRIRSELTNGTNLKKNFAKAREIRDRTMQLYREMRSFQRKLKGM